MVLMPPVLCTLLLAGVAAAVQVGDRNVELQAVDLASLCEQGPNAIDCTINAQTAIISAASPMLPANGTVLINASNLEQENCGDQYPFCSLAMSAHSISIVHGSQLIAADIRLAAVEQIFVDENSAVDVSCTSVYPDRSFDPEPAVGVGTGGGAHAGAGAAAPPLAGQRSQSGQAFGFSDLESHFAAGGGSCCAIHTNYPCNPPKSALEEDMTAAKRRKARASFWDEALVTNNVGSTRCQSPTSVSNNPEAARALANARELRSLAPALGSIVKRLKQEQAAASTPPATQAGLENQLNRLYEAVAGVFTGVIPPSLLLPEDDRIELTSRITAEFALPASDGKRVDAAVRLALGVPSVLDGLLLGTKMAKSDLVTTAPPLAMVDWTSTENSVNGLQQNAYCCVERFNCQNNAVFVSGGGTLMLSVPSGVLHAEGESFLSNGDSADPNAYVGGGAGGTILVDAGVVTVTRDSSGIAFSATGGQAQNGGGGGGGVISVTTPDSQGIQPGWFDVDGGKSVDGSELGGGGVIYITQGNSSSTAPPQLFCVANADLKRRAVTLLDGHEVGVFNTSGTPVQLSLHDCNWALTDFSSIELYSLNMAGSSLTSQQVKINVRNNMQLSLNSQVGLSEVDGDLIVNVSGLLGLQSSLIKSNSLSIYAANISVDAESYVHFSSSANVVADYVIVANDFTQSDIPTTPTTLSITATSIVVGPNGNVAASVVYVAADFLEVQGQITSSTVTVSPQCQLHGPAGSKGVDPDADTSLPCVLNEFDTTGSYSAWLTATTLRVSGTGLITGALLRLCSHELTVDPSAHITAVGGGCQASSGIGAGGYLTNVPGGGAGHGGSGGFGHLLLPTPSHSPTSSPTPSHTPSSSSTPSHTPTSTSSSVPYVPPHDAAMGAGSSGNLVLQAAVTANTPGAEPTPEIPSPTPTPTAAPTSSSAPSLSQGGVKFDNKENPQFVGSGGGGSGGFGGAGGGMIIISADVAEVDGFIMADGSEGNNQSPGTVAGGGGSGGTIVLKLGYFTGAGTVSAGGGDGGTPGGGGGGGGLLQVQHLNTPMRSRSSVLTSEVTAMPTPSIAPVGPIVPGNFSGNLVTGGGHSGGTGAGSGIPGEQDSKPPCSQLGYGSALCEACPKGSFKNFNGSDACLQCPPGNFSDVTAALHCTPCGPTSHSDKYGAATCVPCQEGELPNEARTLCDVCDAGYEPDAESGCTLCIPGYVKSEAGNHKCVPCEPGTKSEERGSTQCVPCPPGQVASESGAFVCRACSSGQFSSPNATVCEYCDAGRFSRVQASRCEACPVNSFSARGAQACKACSVGRFSRVNASLCEECASTPPHTQFLPVPAVNLTVQPPLTTPAISGYAHPCTGLMTTTEAESAWVGTAPHYSQPLTSRCAFECVSGAIHYPSCAPPWEAIIVQTLGGWTSAASGGGVLLLVAVLPGAVRALTAYCAARTSESKTRNRSEFRSGAAQFLGPGEGARGGGNGASSDRQNRLKQSGRYSDMLIGGGGLGRDSRGSSGSHAGSINGIGAFGAGRVDGGSSSSFGFHQPLLDAPDPSHTRLFAASSHEMGWGYMSRDGLDAADESPTSLAHGGTDEDLSPPHDDLRTPVGGVPGTGLLGAGSGETAGRHRLVAKGRSRMTAGSHPQLMAMQSKAAMRRQLLAHSRSMYRGALHVQGSKRDAAWHSLKLRRDDLAVFLHRVYFEGSNSAAHPWRANTEVPDELYSAVLHNELAALQRTITGTAEYSDWQSSVTPCLSRCCPPIQQLWQKRTRERKSGDVAGMLDPFVERLFRNPRARMLGNCLKFGASPCRTLGWVDILVQDSEDAGGAPIGVPRPSLVIPFSGTGEFTTPLRLDLEDLLTRTAIGTMLAPWLPPSARFVTDMNDALRTVQGQWLGRAVARAMSVRAPRGGRGRSRRVVGAGGDSISRDSVAQTDSGSVLSAGDGADEDSKGWRPSGRGSAGMHQHASDMPPQRITDSYGRYEDRTTSGTGGGGGDGTITISGPRRAGNAHGFDDYSSAGGNGASSHAGSSGLHPSAGLSIAAGGPGVGDGQGMMGRSGFDDDDSEDDVDRDAVRAEMAKTPTAGTPGPSRRDLGRRGTASSRRERRLSRKRDSSSYSTAGQSSHMRRMPTERDLVLADEAQGAAEGVKLEQLRALSAMTLGLLKHVQRVVRLTNYALRANSAPYRVGLGFTHANPLLNPADTRLALILLSVSESVTARTSPLALYLSYDSLVLKDMGASRSEAKRGARSGVASDGESNTGLGPDLGTRQPTMQGLVGSRFRRRRGSSEGTYDDDDDDDGEEAGMVAATPGSLARAGDDTAGVAGIGTAGMMDIRLQPGPGLAATTSSGGQADITRRAGAGMSGDAGGTHPISNSAVDMHSTPIRGGRLIDTPPTTGAKAVWGGGGGGRGVLDAMGRDVEEAAEADAAAAMGDDDNEVDGGGRDGGFARGLQAGRGLGGFDDDSVHSSDSDVMVTDTGVDRLVYGSGMGMGASGMPSAITFAVTAAGGEGGAAVGASNRQTSRSTGTTRRSRRSHRAPSQGSATGCASCVALAIDTVFRCVCPCCLFLLSPLPSCQYLVRRACDPLVNARSPMLPGAVALQLLVSMLIEAAAATVCLATFFVFSQGLLILILLLPPLFAVISPIIGVLAFAAGSASAARLHMTVNLVSGLPALLAACILFGLYGSSNDGTLVHGTELHPTPLLLDVWTGIVAPAAWLTVKYYIAHVLPSRVAALECQRDSDVELFLLRKHLGAALIPARDKPGTGYGATA